MSRGRGAPLARGPAGTGGEAGPQGAKGAEGLEGPSALSPLSSGTSESGVYAVGAAAPNGERLTLAAIFPKPLSASIPVSNVFYTPSSTAVPHCSGPGHADPGFLCIYSTVVMGIATPELIDPETDSNTSTGRLGFALSWKTHKVKAIGEDEVDLGTYTVTAP